jgi:hypothetical protein
MYKIRRDSLWKRPITTIIQKRCKSLSERLCLNSELNLRLRETCVAKVVTKGSQVSEKILMNLYSDVNSRMKNLKRF